MQNTWIKVSLICLCVLAGLLLLCLLIALVFSFRQERRAENKVFNSGHVPDVLNGEYTGNSQSKSDWLGKRFDHERQTGINRFPGGDRYPFTTSTGQSIKGNKQVLKLNYNVSGNPWWLRLIVDEVVETAPGKYQGKVFVRLGPLVFTLTYFQLSK
jgi:hypothetical protein